MKQLFFSLSFLLFFITGSKAQPTSFVINPSTVITYEGKSNKYGDVTFSISAMNYKTGSFKYASSIKNNKTGSIKINYKKLGCFAVIGRSIDDYITAAQKNMVNSSRIWLTKPKIDSIIDFNLYREYEKIKVNGKDTLYVDNFTVTPIKYELLINNKPQSVDAFLLKAIIGSGSGITLQVDVTIQNQKTNPIVLQSKSVMKGLNEDESETILLDVNSKEVKNAILK